MEKFHCCVYGMRCGRPPSLLEGTPIRLPFLQSGVKLEYVEHVFANGRKLRLLKGDITRIAAGAIANAANAALRGGGGVDGAIHRAGGPAIMAELDRIRAEQGGCPTGSAVATTAGNLPASFVFHAVGPVYQGGKKGEADHLASCYRSCLELAEKHSVKSITFPSISTGVYGYPLDEAAPIAIGAVADWLAAGRGPVENAAFVLFDQGTFAAYERALQAWVEHRS